MKHIFSGNSVFLLRSIVFLKKMYKLTKILPQIVDKSAASARNISCSAIHCIDQRWRETKKLTENPNAFGPLANLPDYSYLDGRPTPLGTNQKRRIAKQREIATKIVNLSQEINFAKERHARLLAEKEATRQQILDNKLKPKGHLLLKKE